MLSWAHIGLVGSFGVLLVGWLVVWCAGCISQDTYLLCYGIFHLPTQKLIVTNEGYCWWLLLAAFQLRAPSWAVARCGRSDQMCTSYCQHRDWSPQMFYVFCVCVYTVMYLCLCIWSNVQFLMSSPWLITKLWVMGVVIQAMDIHNQFELEYPHRSV